MTVALLPWQEHCGGRRTALPERARLLHWEGGWSSNLTRAGEQLLTITCRLPKCLPLGESCFSQPCDMTAYTRDWFLPKAGLPIVQVGWFGMVAAGSVTFPYYIQFMEIVFLHSGGWTGAVNLWVATYHLPNLQKRKTPVSCLTVLGSSSPVWCLVKAAGKTYQPSAAWHFQTFSPLPAAYSFL